MSGRQPVRRRGSSCVTSSAEGTTWKDPLHGRAASTNAASRSARPTSRQGPKGKRERAERLDRPCPKQSARARPTSMRSASPRSVGDVEHRSVGEAGSGTALPPCPPPRVRRPGGRGPVRSRSRRGVVGPTRAEPSPKPGDGRNARRRAPARDPDRRAGPLRGPPRLQNHVSRGVRRPARMAPKRSVEQGGGAIPSDSSKASASDRRTMVDTDGGVVALGRSRPDAHQQTGPSRQGHGSRPASSLSRNGTADHRKD
jgi:hypothetical protein